MARRGLGILAGVRERGAKRRAARKASSTEAPKDDATDKGIETESGANPESETGKGAEPEPTPRATPFRDRLRAGAARRAARRDARRGGGSGGGAGDGSDGGEDTRPLGDRLPDVPVLGGPDATDTGISGPGAEDGETQTTQEAGQGVVDAEIARNEDQTAAQFKDQARADDFSDVVQSDKDETIERLDDAGDTLAADKLRFEKSTEDTQKNLDEIPTEITNEFNRLRDEFGATTDASFDRIDSQRGDALADAGRGRAAAMQAAVAGIQGNVNNQVAQIMSNPSLTQAQKQSMVSQVRLAGASSMAPAIGATVLAFNQLTADIATKFGDMTTQLESTILTEEAGLTGLQGQAFSQAQVAVGAMTNTLLELNANASVSFANSQSQLLATRSHAAMTGNDILLRTLPEQSEPFSDTTGAAVLAYEIGKDIMLTDYELKIGDVGMDIQIALLRSVQGTTLSNIIGGIWDGFVSGGRRGAAVGGGVALVDSIRNRGNEI